MKGRLGIGLLVLMAVAVGAYAAYAGEGPVQLTLEEAIRRGLAASIAVQRAELNVQFLELEYRQAEVNARATVTPLQLAEAKQAYENALYEANLQKVRAALTVESAYYAVLKAQYTVELRTNALDRALQQVDIAQRRHALGQITDVQLREAEQHLLEAQFALMQAENDLRLVRLQFGQLIGLPDTEWVLTEDVPFEEEEIDLDAAVATARERRFEVIRAKQEVADAEQAVRLADNSYTPRIELERAKIRLAQAELALQQTLNQVMGEVWEAVMRLNEAALRANLAQSRLDLAHANLALAELRYQNGLNTLLDVLAAEAELAEAEVESVAAVYDYNVAKAQYLSAIGMGFERWPGLLGGTTEGAQ